jgi:hypothetical protein
MSTGRPISPAVKRGAGWKAPLLIGAAAALLTGCVAGGVAANGAPDLAVALTGSDANDCTQQAPCVTFDRAYHVAQPGQFVDVAAGSYPEQQLNSDSAKTSLAHVVFRPNAGASVALAGLVVYGSHLTFQNMTVNGDWQTFHETDDVTFRNVTVNGGIFTQSSSNISVIGGSVGGIQDYKPQFGAWPPETTNQNILVDGVTFHDVTRTSDDQHVECLLVAGIDGLVIRNSRFYNCDVFDVSIGSMNGSPPPQNITIENNVFGGANGYYSLDFNDNATSLTNVMIRNNSATQSMYLGNAIPELTNVSVIANVAPYKPWACDARITYAYNVWDGARCARTDLNARSGFRNPSALDLHLVNGAKAINHGDPKSYPNRDIDGRKRPQGKRVDAGAYERA